MALTPAAAARHLAANARGLQALVDGVEPEQARWRPVPGRWSILEVVAHLADEEAEDFRRRLDMTLHRPGEAWPPVDPPRWAVERRYNERDLDGELRRFAGERRRSVAWLDGLSDPPLEAAHEHPRLGRLRAGDLLASWLVHDLIHLRQIVRLKHGWLARSPEGWKVDYAGPF